jgi:broad specificity phosphatase PhoE
MRLVLVRHGETAGQSSIRYYGATDVPLSDSGRAQMRRAAAALAGERFAAVYSSELSRSLEGARLVSRDAAVVPVAGFNEIDFGAWEGLTEEEIAARDPERYRQWRARLSQRGEFHYPSGDSTAAFRRRIVTVLHRILAAAPPGPLLFVLHKGVIRSILAELLRLGELERSQLAVELASIHIVSRAGGLWHAEVLDRTAHLLDRGEELR